MGERVRIQREVGAERRAGEGSGRTGGTARGEAAPEGSPRRARLADLAQRMNDSPSARRLAQLQANVQKPGATAVVQRQIKGGVDAVYRLLKKQDEWQSFIGNESRKSKQYAEVLDEMLQSLHEWDSGFDPAEIAEAIRRNEFTPAGVANAKKAIVSGLEEHIDQEVLSGGHSGEKHYGKDEKYQQERMKKEGKAKVTTLEDSKETKKFFTNVKTTVRVNLLSLLNPIIWDVAEGIKNATVTRPLVKGITDGYVNDEAEFEGYKIILETISVTANGAGSVTITARPRLESSSDFPKTEYTIGGGSQEFSPIVMFWGGNSPTVQVSTGDRYDALYEALEKAIVAPVTAF
jgi:hypothetical protein